MTPEQLQQYVDTALKQRDQFNLVFYPVVFVLSLGGAWLLSYLREKGKNLATKEDVASLTHTVELIKADLGAKQHFSRIRYEREMKVYEELWPKLCELQAGVFSLRPTFELGKTEGMSEEDERLARKKRFMEALRAFMRAVDGARPFYPADVWDQLHRLIKLCWGEGVDWGLFGNWRVKESREDYWDKAEKNAESIRQQIDVICESIRTRLSHFDKI